MAPLQLYSGDDGGQTPFDAIRRARPDGSEYWSARDLMPLMGYDKWQNFTTPLLRAAKTAENQGCDLGQNFTEVSKKPGSGAGRPAIDLELSRFAAYLVAMNGDPHKAEVAAAQAYFAIRTREAEVSLDLTDPLDALEAANVRVQKAIEIARAERIARQEAEEYVKALAPLAAAWTVLMDASGDWSVNDAAKVLSNDPNICIGERRLFTFMIKEGWVYRHQGRPKAYQTQLENGRLAERPYAHPYQDRLGRMVLPEPQVRVTLKGVLELHKRLGGIGTPQILRPLPPSGE